MDGFIKQLSSQTGLEESKVSGFIGQILDFCKKNAPEDVSKEISAEVPGADELMTQAVAAEKESVPDALKPCMPVLEILKKLFGQNQNAQIAEIMTKSGVSPEQGGEMIGKLLEFLKTNVKPETVNKLTEQVPALQSIAG